MMETIIPAMTIRGATAEDAPLILSFIKDLAEYEKLSHRVVATADLIAEALNGRLIEVALAYADEMPVGFALFFRNFSTFLGRPGLYLEDLYVRPDYRSRGVGRELLRYLGKMALERGYGRFEWSVLDWNDPAIEFYRRIGAVAMDEWTTYRLEGDALTNLVSPGASKKNE